jgi:hypothetical protein
MEERDHVAPLIGEQSRDPDGDLRSARPRLPYASPRRVERRHAVALRAGRAVARQVRREDLTCRRECGSDDGGKGIAVEGVVDRSPQPRIVERRNAGVEEEIAGVGARAHVQSCRVSHREAIDVGLRQREVEVDRDVGGAVLDGPDRRGCVLEPQP